MKNSIESGTIFFIVYIAAMFLNFRTFLMGSQPSFEFLISIAYLVMWIIIFRIFLKNKNSIKVLFSTILWIMTGIASSVSFYSLVSNATTTFILPFNILFITPLYGLSFITVNFTMFVALVTIISCFFILFGIKLLIIKEQFSAKDN